MGVQCAPKIFALTSTQATSSQMLTVASLEPVQVVQPLGWSTNLLPR